MDVGTHTEGYTAGRTLGDGAVVTTSGSPITPHFPGGAAPCRAYGKWFTFGGDIELVKGVTYGTFKPNRRGELFPEPEVAARDLELMAQHGVNSLRTYIPAPTWFLDLAGDHGIRVFVGLTGESQISAVADGTSLGRIARRFVREVSSCLEHPAVAAALLGNEIPAPLVRWVGNKKTEDFLYALYRSVKAVRPEIQVSYVNYPTTEYLHLPFLDFVAFNVYLERQAEFDAYLRRLQHIAGERPLVLAELGLDSQRGGEARQADIIAQQTEAAYRAGCAGVFLYAWTDEWYRGGGRSPTGTLV